MREPTFNQEMLSFMRDLFSEPPVTRRGLVQKLLRDERVCDALSSKGIAAPQLLEKLDSEESSIGATYKQLASAARDSKPELRPVGNLPNDIATVTDAAYELLGLYVNPAYDEHLRGGSKPTISEVAAKLDAFVPLPVYASKVLRVLARDLPDERERITAAADLLANSA